MDSHKSSPVSNDDTQAIDSEAIGIERPGLSPAAPGERPHNEAFSDVLTRNLARRSFLQGIAASVPVLITGSSLMAPSEALGHDRDDRHDDHDRHHGHGNHGRRGKLSFKPIAPSTVDDVVVPEGYRYHVVIRWGDPLSHDAPAFNPGAQTAAAQRKQFGYNCDFVGYFPLERDGHALLCVNHEYTTGTDMFVGYVPGAIKEQTDIELAAHGGSVVEIERAGPQWKYRRSSKFNRRITGDTPMRITGPAAGHPLMKTSADPTGTQVLGMLNNCSGGKTPWGTWLTCEENFNQYFANNALVANASIKAAHTRYGVSSGATSRRWENFYPRFDASKEPNEPFRFGWVVEIDPYDPDFVPRKRTALGRCKHEAATTAIAKSGQVVVYSGDDQQFDYVYKFVSKDRYRRNDRRHNLDLLDEGTLYVAKFNDNGTGTWIPLTMDNPVLAAMFGSQGEIVIKTRLAADAVGATAMDRPEDLQPNPVNGKVYLTMTNNSARTTVVADPGSAKANPRVPNFNGHIIELTERHNDYAAKTFSWNIFLLCGNPELNLLTSESQLTPGLPSNATFFAGYAQVDKLGKIASPDNIAFDNNGNLWIATDGQPSSADIGRPNDAIHAVATEGRDRGHLRQFLSGPVESEICGPEFSDDGRTLFCAIQHPGEGGGIPNSRSTWPDRHGYALPSVVAVRHKDGDKIGE
jgi:secreted PhoX family phosphatase